MHRHAHLFAIAALIMAVDPLNPIAVPGSLIGIAQGVRDVVTSITHPASFFESADDDEMPI
ncbi:hypothetical protein ACFOY2_21675 [Nonomuraea purpurea]|uniref:Uncharacterized protein n=1 Tax=Nonomuraea purpurea TaxID=1849276 RepID=A0ABV8GCL2_9ACTN